MTWVQRPQSQTEAEERNKWWQNEGLREERWMQRARGGGEGDELKGD